MADTTDLEVGRRIFPWLTQAELRAEIAKGFCASHHPGIPGCLCGAGLVKCPAADIYGPIEAAGVMSRLEQVRLVRALFAETHAEEAGNG